MTLYVTSPNFNVLIIIINFLLAKNRRENILQRTIEVNLFAFAYRTVSKRFLPTRRDILHGYIGLYKNQQQWYNLVFDIGLIRIGIIVTTRDAVFQECGKVGLY